MAVSLTAVSLWQRIVVRACGREEIARLRDVWGGDRKGPEFLTSLSMMFFR